MRRSFDGVSRYALQLSLMEIGLGSFLHAFRVPFSGFLLSLNQCFVLNRALSHSSSIFHPLVISNTAALLKPLSPYGKKFTPMLAISMQGLLFNIGVFIFGNNLLGRCAGSLLLSLWPMVQPALIYIVIYGGILVNMSVYYNQMLVKMPWFSYLTLEALVAGYIFIHLFLSLAVCLLTYFLPVQVLDSYDRYIMSYSSTQLKPLSLQTKNTFLQKMRGVLKDMISPIFLLTLVLSGFFFYATLHSLESFLYSYFRLIAVALLTFFLIRNLSSEWCIDACSRIYFLKKCTPYVEEIFHHIHAKTQEDVPK